MKDAMLKVAKGISLEMSGLIVGLSTIAISFVGGCAIGAMIGFQAAQAAQKGGAGGPPQAPVVPNDPALLVFAGFIGLLTLLSLFLSLAGKFTCRAVPEEWGNARSRATMAAALVALAIPFSAISTLIAFMPGVLPLFVGPAVSAVSQVSQVLAATAFTGFLANFPRMPRGSAVTRFAKPTIILGIITAVLMALANIAMVIGIAAGGIPNAPGQAPAARGAGLAPETMIVGAGGCLSIIGMIVGLVSVVFYMILLTSARREVKRRAVRGNIDDVGYGRDPRSGEAWYDERPDEQDENPWRRD